MTMSTRECVSTVGSIDNQQAILGSNSANISVELHGNVESSFRHAAASALLRSSSLLRQVSLNSVQAHAEPTPTCSGGAEQIGLAQRDHPVQNAIAAPLSPVGKILVTSLVPGGSVQTIGGGFRWRKGEMIAQKSSGCVYLGLNDANGSLMAVKEVRLPSASDVAALQSEINVMR